MKAEVAELLSKNIIYMIIIYIRRYTDKELYQIQQLLAEKTEARCARWIPDNRFAISGISAAKLTSFAKLH